MLTIFYLGNMNFQHHSNLYFECANKIFKRKKKN